MRKLFFLLGAVCLISACSPEKKEAQEILERELGENRNVKVHKVFDGSKYNTIQAARDTPKNMHKTLCGTVTYNTSEGVPIRGKVPFEIVVGVKDKCNFYCAPKVKIGDYSPEGGTAGLASCGEYIRSEDHFEIRQCVHIDDRGVPTAKCLDRKTIKQSWKTYYE